MTVIFDSGSICDFCQKQLVLTWITDMGMIGNKFIS